MPRGELLKKLFHSYSQGDPQSFHDVAAEIIRDEESKNNRVLANALRRNLGSSVQRPLALPDKNNSTSRKLAVVRRGNHSIRHLNSAIRLSHKQLRQISLRPGTPSVSLLMDFFLDHLFVSSMLRTRALLASLAII